MSVHVSSQVWRHSTGELGSLLVMLALADHADDAGVCWPVTKAIAAKTRLERRQVGRILAGRSEAGEIDRWHYREGSVWRSVYRVTVGDLEGLRGAPPEGFGVELVPGPPPTSRRQNVAPNEEGSEATSTPLEPRIRGDISPRASNEPSVVEQTSIAAGRRQDPVWNVLAELYGEPATPPEKSRRGRVSRDLKAAMLEQGIPQADDQADEIRRRADAYRRHWPLAAFTETALWSRWTALGQLVAPEHRRAEPIERARRWSRANPEAGLEIAEEVFRGLGLNDAERLLALDAHRAAREETDDAA